MRIKSLKFVLVFLVYNWFLVFNNVIYADIYLVPLSVNGYYELHNYIDFNINLGVQFSQINEVRFQAQGDIFAVDAPGLFECTLVAAPAKLQYSCGPEITPSSPPESVAFDFDAGFFSVDGATWDFLLDGEAYGYVWLVTSMMYPPEYPPENITGNINSAFLLIDAIPVPEPTTLIFIGICWPAFRAFSKKKI